MPTYSTPDLDDYPSSFEGALAFVGDCFAQVGLNTVNGFTNACIYPLDATLGSAMEEKFGTNPFDIPSSTFYDCFSDWYLNHGNHSGGGGYRDGSGMDTDGSYSWNYPETDDTIYLDDGCGGFFTIISRTYIELPFIEHVVLQVYHRGELVVDFKWGYNCKNLYPSDYPHSDLPSLYYGVYSVEGSSNAIFYYYYSPGAFIISDDISGSSLASNRWKYTRTNKFTSATQTATAGTYTFQVKDYSIPSVQNNSTTLYSFNPITNNIENNYFYGADQYGQPCLYDSNNNIYNFNNDGTLGDSHLYLMPDFSTLNDNDKIELTNLLSNYYMSVYLNLLRLKDSGSSDILPFLTTITNQLMGINDSSSDAISWLKSINSSVNQLNSDTSTLLRSINDSILALSKTPGSAEDNTDLIILLTELKKGLLGDSEPYKPDQIIDLLEQIAENTSPNPEDLDEQPIDFQFDYYVQSVPDMLRERLDVSSYFKQLKNIFSMFFNDDFLSDIDFDTYFDTSTYMDSSDSDASVAAASYSTADFPDVFGEDLAQEDVDISSSVYLTASVYSSGSTIEGSSIPAPYLEVHLLGHSYNLFEYLTPEAYDKIKPLKSLISLFLYALYFLWVVRSVLPSLFTGSNINFYNSTKEDL